MSPFEKLKAQIQTLTDISQIKEVLAQYEKDADAADAALLAKLKKERNNRKKT